MRMQRGKDRPKDPTTGAEKKKMVRLFYLTFKTYLVVVLYVIVCPFCPSRCKF